MASEVSREVLAAVRWLIVGVAVGIVPTYVIMSERSKKESAAAANAASTAAAASVYAAWNAAPKPVCPAPPITVATVEAVTGAQHARPAHVANGNAAAAPKNDENGVDESQMMAPMLNMMQGMMNDNGSSGGTPDMNELMKNMPKK
jgi:hypothetical protein